jgi:hypothetical protein
MQEFYRMSTTAQQVADHIDSRINDCKDACKSGNLVGDARGCIIRTVIGILDGWTPRLKYATRCEVLNWLQAEYGLCL